MYALFRQGEAYNQLRRLVIAKEIHSVAVLGAGTMGAGIAGLCAQQGCRVLMLDLSIEDAEKGLERIVSGRPPAIDDVGKAENISLGTFDRDLKNIQEYDWVCEAIVEDLQTKRELIARVEPFRKKNSMQLWTVKGARFYYDFLPIKNSLTGKSLLDN